jgi:hypothetical protein
VLRLKIVSSYIRRKSMDITEATLDRDAMDRRWVS